MEEKNLKKCKVCGELKLRIQSGKFNKKDKRWVGEDGLQWNGLTCGKCNRERVKNTMSNLRNGSYCGQSKETNIEIEPLNDTIDQKIQKLIQENMDDSES